MEGRYMKTGIFFGALTLIGALAAYYINFNQGTGLSSDQNDWASFGSFLGGFTTPIITFITMYMLIASLNLQKKANDSLIAQNQQAKEASSHQREVEDLRSFESTFYSLSEVARAEFGGLELTTADGKIHKGSVVVNEVEDILEKQAINNLNFAVLCETFDDLDEKCAMSIFSAVRGFYILLKIVIEGCPERHKERYIDICVYSMPVKLIHLVCLAKVFTNWENLEYLSEHGFFTRAGIKEYVADWRKLSGKQS